MHVLVPHQLGFLDNACHISLVVKYETLLVGRHK